MSLARRSAPRIPLICLVLPALVAQSGVDGQEISSNSSASLSVAAPTESEYDAGASGATGTYRIQARCRGGAGPAGCRLFLQYGSNSQGQQVGIEYAIVSLSGQCGGAVASATVWYSVNPMTAVLSTAANRNCIAAFRFRVSPLAWSLFAAPAPGGAYRQQVRFVFTSP